MASAFELYGVEEDGSLDSFFFLGLRGLEDSSFSSLTVAEVRLREPLAEVAAVDVLEESSSGGSSGGRVHVVVTPSE